MRIRSIVVLLLLVGAAPATAQLQHFQTTLALQNPVVNVTGVDSVTFLWSTTETRGTVYETELNNLVMKLRIGGILRYSDTVVAGGQVQLFDGQVRVPEAGYFWRFDLETGELEQMVSAGLDLAFMSTGSQYVVNDSIAIQIDGIVDVRHFIDGVIQDGQSDRLDVQTTELMVFYDGFETGETSLWSSTTAP